MKLRNLFAISMICIVLLSLVGCETFFNYKSFSECSIGEEFGKNRDGYNIKVNARFYIYIEYKEADNMYLYRLNDVGSDDVLGDSELYYKGEFDKCYSSEKNIILKLKDKESFVLINCGSVSNEQISSNIEDFDVDLLMYTELDL